MSSPSDEIWVEHRAGNQVFGPTQICYKGYPTLDKFKVAVRNNVELQIPPNVAFNFYTFDEGNLTQIANNKSPSSYGTENSYEKPLIVKVLVLEVEPPKKPQISTTRHPRTQGTLLLY